MKMEPKKLSLKDLDVVQNNSRDVTVGLDGKTVVNFNGSNFRAFVSTCKIKSNNASILTNHHRRKKYYGHRFLAMEQKEEFIQFKGHFDDPEDTPFVVKIWVENNEVYLRLENEKFDEIGIAIPCPKDERVMGFGEQFRFLDMSNKSFELLVQEQGIGKGAQPISTLVNLVSKGSSGNEYTSYAPMPIYVTSSGQCAFFLEKTIYWFNVQVDRLDQIIASAKTKCLTCCIIQANSMLKAIERHTAITGRLKPLPPFAYKTILGLRGGTKKITPIIDKVKKMGVPIGSIWIEDWEGRRGPNGGPPLWWRWYPDEKLYPNFKKWTEKLNKDDIKVLGYANPMLSLTDENPLYIEAKEKGYLIKNKEGKVYENSFFTSSEIKYAQVDLSNPEAYDWLKEKMKAGMLDSGLSGWMADYGEYVPLDSVPFEGDATRVHCSTPYLWAKLNSELIEETGNRGKVLTFSRSASLFSNQVSCAYWAGDQNPTFDKYDGMASSINALITSGISGMSISHTDIGGFTTLMTPIYKLTRSKEVMFRWLDYAALTPIFRTHDGNFDNPLNYQFYYDEEGYNYYARCAKAHCELGFYFKELEKEAVEKGLPMCRALCLHYPEDKKVYYMHREYLLGTDLLVFPVCKKKAKNTLVYVPEGNWIDPYTNREYHSGEHKIPTPLGQFPVLINMESKHKDKFIDIFKN